MSSPIQQPEAPTGLEMSDATIGFIGAGQMAQALARGFVQAGLVAGECLLAADPNPDAGRAFAAAASRSRIVDDNVAVVAGSTTIFLATKPQQWAEVATQVSQVPKEGKLFVSILAGVPLGLLCAQLGTQRVIRVMPNTPCLVGRGASAFALGPGATAQDRDRVLQLLQAVGVALLVDESQLDAVTGLSGSGPAYIYAVIEALSDGGVRMGLARQAATRLAAQTVLGAAQMVLETGEHPGVLKDRVTSPAGTTIAGLQVLERHGLRAAFIDAVEAATIRARELGQV